MKGRGAGTGCWDGGGGGRGGMGWDGMSRVAGLG